ncbi:phage holin family protein [Ornithinimicrobium sp. LYQ92]|uniref:phage holin family protein n=1 Tax=Serinicoccus sp. LYQ92 TaxID=3378798 RepID=UPI0038523B3B
MTHPLDHPAAPPPGGTPAGQHEEPRGHSLSTLGETIGHISQDLSDLIRQETMLAKAELSASAKRGGKGAGLLGGAGVAGHFVLLFLSLALWWGLGDLIGLGWSALVVAVLWAVVAAVLAVLGRKELKDIQGMPQTVDTVQEIPDALKGNEDHR